MSNQTSMPTNLNSELENSTESANRHPHDDTNSNPPSAIRQNNDSDFSQNQGYISPNIELSNATEDSTTRLHSIRDDLVRQVRDQLNAEIELEIRNYKILSTGVIAGDQTITLTSHMRIRKAITMCPRHH